MQSLGSPPAVATRSAYGSDGQFSGSYVSAIRLPACTPEQRALAWSGLKALMRPARDNPDHVRAIFSELTKTWATMASRATSGGEMEIALETMADDLADMPADIVVRAIGFWRRNEKWRPTPSELRHEAEGEVRYRRALWAAFKDADA